MFLHNFRSRANKPLSPQLNFFDFILFGSFNPIIGKLNDKNSLALYSLVKDEACGVLKS